MNDLPGSQTQAAVRPWPAWIEVDLDAIAANVRAICGQVGFARRVAAVVKAEAYGHGAVAVALSALEAGASWLAVARVREAIHLRNAGIVTPILVLGPVESAETQLAVEYELRPTLVRPDQVRSFSRAAVDAGADIPVHVEMDTGISRYGIPLEQVASIVEEINDLPGVHLEGVYSHFATADESDLTFARQQLGLFWEGISSLRGAGHSIPMVHMAASAATLAMGVDCHFDMVRLGLSMFGVYPSTHLLDAANLLPALTLHSRVTRVFELRRGQSVGYGRTFVASGPMRVALIQVGYADGLPRSHSNRGTVLVNGRRAPLIGRVSMDQCVVDVGQCGNVAEGDAVVVIGRQGTEAITVDEFASLSGTISYESLTNLGYRLPRVYTRSGRDVGVGFLDEGTVEWLKA